MEFHIKDKIYMVYLIDTLDTMDKDNRGKWWHPLQWRTFRWHLR